MSNKCHQQAVKKGFRIINKWESCFILVYNHVYKKKMNKQKTAIKEKEKGDKRLITAAASYFRCLLITEKVFQDCITVKGSRPKCSKKQPRFCLFISFIYNIIIINQYKATFSLICYSKTFSDCLPRAFIKLNFSFFFLL